MPTRISVFQKTSKMMSMPTAGFEPLLEKFIDIDLTAPEYRQAKDESKRVTLFMHSLRLITSQKDLIKAIGVSHEGRLTVLSIEPRGLVYHSCFPANKSVRLSGLEFRQSYCIEKSDLTFNLLE